MRDVVAVWAEWGWCGGEIGVSQERWCGGGVGKVYKLTELCGGEVWEALVLHGASVVEALWQCGGYLGAVWGLHGAEWSCAGAVWWLCGGATGLRKSSAGIRFNISGSSYL